MTSKPVRNSALHAIEEAIWPIEKLSVKVHRILLARAREGFFANHQPAGSIRNLTDELLDELLSGRESDDHS